MARALLGIAGGLTAAVGMLHLAVAAVQYNALSFDALWFAGSGLAVVLIGVLTLLLRSAPAFSELRLAAFGANVAGLALAMAFGALTRWREPQGPVLVTLFLAGAAGAIMHRGAMRAP
ncbi:hypothetical protein [Roseisolibacter agri]|uniref:hypothetical protein n=1 Tax=Roseisolibacter agri TaxID=2014610 RepID=UPI0024E18C06|nr:hypothetical protein [Roseisolibacter agri]